MARSCRSGSEARPVSNRLAVCLAVVCVAFLAGITEPQRAHAQITQGPSGPFMAEDSTGRIIGAADYTGAAALNMWITVGSVSAPIHVDRDATWEYWIGRIYYTSFDCSGQAYVQAYDLEFFPSTPTAAFIPSDDPSETLYLADPSSVGLVLTSNSYEGDGPPGCQVGALTTAFVAAEPVATLAGEFTPPFYVTPNPAYNTAIAVPFGAPWALAIVLAGAYLNVLRRKRTGER